MLRALMVKFLFLVQHFGNKLNGGVGNPHANPTIGPRSYLENVRARVPESQVLLSKMLTLPGIVLSFEASRFSKVEG